jgi:DNA-directed RNA polymerase subunit M/transcription elongation factor TFIIS
MSENRKYQEPPQPVDISDTETITCEECGNASFIQSFFLKRISALMSPNGKEAIVPIQVFACGNCGSIPKNMMSQIQPSE